MAPASAGGRGKKPKLGGGYALPPFGFLDEKLCALVGEILNTDKGGDPRILVADVGLTLAIIGGGYIYGPGRGFNTPEARKKWAEPYTDKPLPAFNVSQDELAVACNMSRGRVARYFKRAEENGWIVELTPSRPKDKSRGGIARTYTFGCYTEAEKPRSGPTEKKPPRAKKKPNPHEGAPRGLVL